MLTTTKVVGMISLLIIIIQQQLNKQLTTINKQVLTSIKKQGSVTTY
nr:MAG TPA: hypothetical protein [Crassvirales sp.]